MERRVFLGAVAGILLTEHEHVGARAGSKVWRIGLLYANSREDLMAQRSYDAFLQGMRELGLAEGKDFIIEGRFADGNYERLPRLAGELVRLNVDIIIAAPSPAIRAAKDATATIPIVFPSTGDPVGAGFAASLARPGGNLTGLSNSNVEVSAKLVELLKTMAPATARIAILVNPGSTSESAMVERVDAAARSLGMQTVVIEARTPDEIERGFDSIRQQRADALLIAGDAFLSGQSPLIANLAIKFRLPSITQSSRYARAGGLLGYGSAPGSWRRAAVCVDKILKGAKPGELAIEQPTKLMLLINRKTANTLGLAIPQSLLLMADEVIE